MRRRQRVGGRRLRRRRKRDNSAKSSDLKSLETHHRPHSTVESALPHANKLRPAALPQRKVGDHRACGAPDGRRPAHHCVRT